MLFRSSVQSGLGAEAAFDLPTALGLLTPHCRVTWRHEFADTTETAIGNFVVAPGLIREQVRVQRTASLIDSAPTILDLLGLPVPGGYQGMSLLQSRRQMALFYTDYSLGLLGLRDGRWKFIYELESGRSRLFDLAKDARETENFATQRPDRAQAYGEHLRRWAAAQRNLILHRTGDGACSER